VGVNQGSTSFSPSPNPNTVALRILTEILFFDLGISQRDFSLSVMLMTLFFLALMDLQCYQKHLFAFPDVAKQY
jgi:hypothetical protein